MITAPFWVSAFLDLAPADFDRGAEFWQRVTGYRLSERRGAGGEFATLVPPDGDDYLRVQRLGSGDGRIHLDLHVEEPTIAAEAAIELGAHALVRHELGYVVLRSPGGFTFCLVGHQASTRPAPATWADGTRSQVDQVCLDLPPELHDAEVAFWQGLTGWPLESSGTGFETGRAVPRWPSALRRPSSTSSPVAPRSASSRRAGSEFSRLQPPDALPLRWLLQRLDDPGGPVTAHLDLACDDREAETARHEVIGATVVRVHEGWTVLTDPVGTTYCITRRRP